MQGYVLVQGILQWPNLNINAETVRRRDVYKSMSLLDTFPIGDPRSSSAFLEAQYPGSVRRERRDLDVFARNIVSYFNTVQQALTPQ